MLKELKEDQMVQKLPKDKILTYHVNWNEDGGIHTSLSFRIKYSINLVKSFS